MQTIESDKIVFSDVDDTLLMWNDDKSFASIDPQSIGIVCPFQTRRDPFEEPKIYYLRPNHWTIGKLKDLKAKGYTVVVWSAAGWIWAEAVVKALKIEDIVDLVMSKPDICIDDLPPNEWIRELIYPR
jgi:hypothetical protein